MCLSMSSLLLRWIISSSFSLSYTIEIIYKIETVRDLMCLSMSSLLLLWILSNSFSLSYTIDIIYNIEAV
jgi:hypothetical protein